MKKTYIAPKAQIIDIETQVVIAGSVDRTGVRDGYHSGRGRDPFDEYEDLF